MNREIKFRGKRISDGKWLYGSLITGLFSQSCNILDTSEHTQFDSFQDFDDLDTEVLPETVGQFTGLHDKNGKEIYEGDILNYALGVGVVEFLTVAPSKSSFNIVRRDQNNEIVGIFTFNTAFHKNELIGNIHENPELLTSPD